MALRFHRLLGGSLLNFSTEYVSTVEFKMETSKQKCETSKQKCKIKLYLSHDQFPALI